MILQSLTFELRILARKKRMLRVDPKKKYKKILTFYLDAQGAKPGQPLAPILGQVQINVGEFVHYFNKKTEDYTAGTRLSIKLYVNWDKTYFIEIKAMTLSELIGLFEYPGIKSNLPNAYNIGDGMTDDDISSSEWHTTPRWIDIRDFYRLIAVYSVQYKINLECSCRVLYGQLHQRGTWLVDLSGEGVNIGLDVLLSKISAESLCGEIYEL